MFDSSLNRMVLMLSFLAVSHFSETFSQPHEKVTMSAATCQNYLYISGESNINQFSFRYNKVNLQTKYNNNNRDTGNIVISIPIKDFEPSNPMMYEDFLSLMKESAYPKIHVSFSKKQLQRFRWDLPESFPDIHITIAGITRTYKIQCSLDKCSDYFYLSGEKIIKLSDFQIKPPEKMMGLVKVNNEINVNFGFIITFTNDIPISATL